MAWQPSETAARFLRESESTYGITHKTEVYEDNPMPGGRPIVKTPAVIECWIMDITTRKVYATGTGAGEKEALDDAVAKAEVAEKPMTPAQERDRVRAQMGNVAAENAALKQASAAKDGEIATLAASVVAMQAQMTALMEQMQRQASERSAPPAPPAPPVEPTPPVRFAEQPAPPADPPPRQRRNTVAPS